MPLNSYCCDGCGHFSDLFRGGPIADDPLVCEACGSERIYQVPAMPSQVKARLTEGERDDIRAHWNAYMDDPATKAKLDSGELQLTPSSHIDPAGTTLEQRINGSN